MKRLATILALGALLAGCASPSGARHRRNTYAEMYLFYLTNAEVRPIGKEEIAAATAAATFLRTYCGWSGTRGVDSNGVPIIHPN